MRGAGDGAVQGLTASVETVWATHIHPPSWWALQRSKSTAQLPSWLRDSMTSVPSAISSTSLSSSFGTLDDESVHACPSSLQYELAYSHAASYGLPPGEQAGKGSVASNAATSREGWVGWLVESSSMTPPPPRLWAGLNISTGRAHVKPRSSLRQSLPWELVSSTVELSRRATARGPPLGSCSLPGTVVSAPQVPPPSVDRL